MSSRQVRSAEEILLQVPNVRHKKQEGTLYVMGERIAWMSKTKADTFAVNHKYTDIRSQKISPAGKPKVQLQLVMHADGDGPSTIFQFVHPDGAETQMRERDAVKELLQQLLPKFKKKVNKELEERHRMLSEVPGLLQLYKDLVITQIVTPEEFWAQHAPSKCPPSRTGQGSSQSSQKVGVSGSFLAEIKPQADGANGLKYNLTPDIIEAIFKTYPAVKKKHFENVPNKMSEQEFWTKFFQSHYFHRDRLIGHHPQQKDIFTECAKDDDKAIREQLKAGVRDRVANVGAFSDKTLDDNYGSGADEKVNQANLVHQNLIKRFNQHSIMVMRTSGESEAKPEAVDMSRKRLHEKLSYEDLEQPAEKKTSVVNLSKVERYLSGPTPAHTTDYLTVEEVSRSRAQIRQQVSAWRDGATGVDHVLSAPNAVSALIALSPGGELMKSARSLEAVAGQCPDSVQRELQQLYASLCELARHFWACFPPTSAQLQEKAAKMYATLRKFQAVKLTPFQNELTRNYSATTAKQLTAHCEQMLEAAFRKFESWKQKKLPPIR